MRSFSWLHLILAVLIIIFATLGPMYTWLVVVLAAVIAVFSIFGVCYCVPGKGYNKKELKPTPKKKR